jgi:GNAT superfamily N-acetyltransferase
MGLAHYLKQTGFARQVKSMLRVLPRRASGGLLLRMLRKLYRGEQLPPPPVQEPYRLLRHVPGDEEAWLELLNASGEFGCWNRDRLHDEIGATLLPEGGIFVARGNQLVGCAAACFMEQYQPYAILMYVTVLPEHQGKGLGQALVGETMRVAQRASFPGLLLHTENHRLAAVRTYFQLGFLPRLAEGAAGKRQWADVLSRALLQGGR